MTTTIKNLETIQKSVIKQTKGTLIGGVKMWCNLFQSSKEIASILKEMNIAANAADIAAISKLAKDKEMVLKACLLVLPNIDGKIIRFVPFYKEYVDPALQADKGLKRDADWIANNVVCGNEFKAFGFVPVENLDGAGKYLPTINEEGKFVKVAVIQQSFGVELISKCVAKYISSTTEDK